MQNKCTKILERLTEIVNDGYLWEENILQNLFLKCLLKVILPC